MIRKFLNGGFFYIGFFIAILGAANGAFWWGPSFFLAILVIHLIFYGNPKKELLFVLLICLFGYAVELAFVYNQIISYKTELQTPVPLWIISVWGMYAMTVDHSLSWMKQRKWLAFPLGAISAPFSYLAGVKIGAATILSPFSTFCLVIGFAWFWIVPGSFFLREVIEKN